MEKELADEDLEGEGQHRVNFKHADCKELKEIDNLDDEFSMLKQIKDREEKKKVVTH